MAVGALHLLDAERRKTTIDEMCGMRKLDAGVVDRRRLFGDVDPFETRLCGIGDDRRAELRVPLREPGDIANVSSGCRLGERAVATEAQPHVADDDAARAAMLLMAVAAPPRIQHLPHHAEIGTRLGMRTNLLVAGETRVICDPGKRRGMACFAISREEAVRIG